jgi:hypothetical protein
MFASCTVEQPRIVQFNIVSDLTARELHYGRFRSNGPDTDSPRGQAVDRTWTGHGPVRVRSVRVLSVSGPLDLNRPLLETYVKYP